MSPSSTLWYLISLRLSSDSVASSGLLVLLLGGVGDLGRGAGFGVAFLDLGFLPRTLLVSWMSVKRLNKSPFILMGI